MIVTSLHPNLPFKVIDAVEPVAGESDVYALPDKYNAISVLAAVADAEALMTVTVGVYLSHYLEGPFFNADDMDLTTAAPEGSVTTQDAAKFIRIDQSDVTNESGLLTVSVLAH